MTNEELALQIKSGNWEYSAQLWNNIQKLMHKLSNNAYILYKDRFATAGITPDDIFQECFFVMLNAVESYKPGYKFNTYISYHFKNRVKILLGRYQLNCCDSLDEELDEEFTLKDIIEDPSGQEAIDTAADNIDLYKAINALPEQERKIIKYYFFYDMPIGECANKLNLGDKAQRTKNKALYHLGQSPQIRSMAEYYRDGLKNTGFSYFRDTGTSSVERAVIKYIDGKC